MNRLAQGEPVSYPTWLSVPLPYCLLRGIIDGGLSPPAGSHPLPPLAGSGGRRRNPPRPAIPPQNLRTSELPPGVALPCSALGRRRSSSVRQRPRGQLEERLLSSEEPFELIDHQSKEALVACQRHARYVRAQEGVRESNDDSLVKTRFEEVPAISHICALPYVGVVYGIETVYCTPARVRLF